MCLVVTVTAQTFTSNSSGIVSVYSMQISKNSPEKKVCQIKLNESAGFQGLIKTMFKFIGTSIYAIVACEIYLMVLLSLSSTLA